MATVLPASAPPRTFDSLAELLESIGGVPLDRIRANPAPGTATEQDLAAIRAHEGRLYELVDGVLVEKTIGYYESVLAITIAHFIALYLDEHDLGVLGGADGIDQISPGVRIPDVSFVAWDKLRSANVLRQPILAAAPDLAVEVLSTCNTRSEMVRKLREYFEVGVRLVSYLHPELRTMEVFTGVNQSKIIDEHGTVDGGNVLPGFEMRLAEIFARADRRPVAEQRLVELRSARPCAKKHCARPALAASR